MYTIKKYSIACLLLFVTLSTSAQLTIRPNVTQAGIVQKSQLWSIATVYMFDDNPEAFFEVTITDRLTGLPVLVGRSSPVKLSKGPKLFTESEISPINYTSSNTQFTMDATGLLPAGLYQACYRVFSTEVHKKDPLSEECIAIDVEALSPPLLNLPADSSLLTVKYPQFVWLPPTPISIFPDLQYDFILTEVLPRQSSQEAVQRNIPLYSTSALKESTLIYPSSFPQLDTGKLYAWQIVARNGRGYGAKSEIWVFRLVEDKPVKENNPFIYYPKLSKQIYSTLYSAGNPIRFEINNERNEVSGQVTLFKAGSEQGKPIASKKLSLTPGQNFISWDVSLPKAKTDQTLVLKVVFPSGDSWGCLMTLKASK